MLDKQIQVIVEITVKKGIRVFLNEWASGNTSFYAQLSALDVVKEGEWTMFDKQIRVIVETAVKNGIDVHMNEWRKGTPPYYAELRAIDAARQCADQLIKLAKTESEDAFINEVEMLRKLAVKANAPVKPSSPTNAEKLGRRPLDEGLI